MSKSESRTAAVILLLMLFPSLVVLGQGQGRRRGRGIPSLDNDPFVGITSGGRIEKGLFKIGSTGVTTKPVVDAATKFLDGLTTEQRKRTVFPVNDTEWRKWDNRHFYKRQGVGFNEMNEKQRKLAFSLMRASLSAKGLKTSQDVMKLNGTLAELADNFEEYGEWLYWITVMGEPSPTKPWGWQIDGHHLTINYFVLGDQVVMSPVFMGSEPVEAKAGKFKGTIVLQPEQDSAFELIQSLNKAQRKLAIVETSKAGTNNLTEAWKDNVDLDYAGIPASKLNNDQQAMLLEVVYEFVGKMSNAHAKVKMDEVKKHLDRTHFAWIGDTEKNSVFYYRIHSPVVLIEFDHQRRVAPFRSREPTRDHIHAVVRTPNGNDYGKDLLRQHYAKHHSPDHGKAGK